MENNFSKSGRRGALLAVGVALAVWLLHLGGALRFADGPLYDLTVRYPLLTPGPNRQVLLIRADPQVLDEDEHVAPRLLEILEDLGTERIVFATPPAAATEAFYRRAQSQRNVLFGRALLTDPESPDSQRVAEWPPAARASDLHWGLTVVPPVERGIHRRQWAGLEVQDSAHETL
ncbi:MAG: hypothetical protein R3202_06035, partial [Candidatus Competibacterales bacterium]|nr:hypothetical protein [Candidatus Competibacterales bacterium]